jgi:hypothetical protein
MLKVIKHSKYRANGHAERANEMTMFQSQQCRPCGDRDQFA